MNVWENMAELISKNSIDSDEIVPPSNDDIDVVKLPESATLERKETIWFESKREGKRITLQKDRAWFQRLFRQ